MDCDKQRLTVLRPPVRQRRVRESGRARAAAQYQQGTGWLVLASALLAIATGIALGHALILAGGLVLAATAVHLLQSRQIPTWSRRRARKL